MSSTELKAKFYYLTDLITLLFLISSSCDKVLQRMGTWKKF